MSDEKVTSRREAMKGIAIIAGAIATEPFVQISGLANPTHHTAGPVAPAAAMPYQPVFFNEHQYKTVDILSELIIPVTDTPGASAAGVVAYIDTVVKEDAKLQGAYRQGLAWLDQKANASYGADFVKIKPESQHTLLTLISTLKDTSKDENAEGKDFFRTIKNMTIDGYYTSKIGIHQELHYQGNNYLTEFPGCNHTEHKS
ncbi:MAG: gluconate 2-dehydrogenase subunit 3 family protein [Acidobacteria bacterium]|nr:gluconate 2-dehydrogenase subunit 3 family protein [Acidobacteriota bacterium]